MKGVVTMKVRELMTSDVRTCRPDTNLGEVVQAMWERDCGAMPVVNDEGRVVGMITDRDICIALATRGRSAERIAVREVAQGHAYTCLPEDDVAAALKTMKAQRVRRLPVVTPDGHVRGILSFNDIVTHAGAALPAAIVSTLASICEHRSPIAAVGAA
jgi:CBS domain-containing protein